MPPRSTVPSPRSFCVGRRVRILLDSGGRACNAAPLRGTASSRSCWNTTCAPVPLDTMPLHTLAAAVAWVRRNAAQLRIAPDRIAVGGLSAGAHTAGMLAAVWHWPEWFEPDTDLQCHRPNAAVLCYPVVTAGEYGHRGSFARLAGTDPGKTACVFAGNAGGRERRRCSCGTRWRIRPHGSRTRCCSSGAAGKR